MRRVISLLTLSALIIAVSFCETAVSQTDVAVVKLTHVGVFGAEGLPDEYLLVSPRHIAVDDNGNIYVADEKKIKVYTPEFKERAILGGPGQGPGEFTTVFDLNISPSGYISAGDWRWYNVFKPDYTFLKTIGKKVPGAFAGNFPKAVVLSENEWVDDTAEFLELVDGINYVSRKIYHHKGDETVEIASYRHRGSLSMGGSTMSFGTGGEGVLEWRMLTRDKIMYAYTGSDIEEKDGRHYYKFYIYSLSDGTRTTVRKEYTPVPLPEESYKYYEEKKDKSPISKLAYDIVKKQRYLTPFNYIYADGGRIFCFTHSTSRNEDVLFDVFDAESGKYINSFYYPKLGEYSSPPRCIKNGIAYRTAKNEEEFTVIEVYTLDPAVYGK